MLLILIRRMIFKYKSNNVDSRKTDNVAVLSRVLKWQMGLFHLPTGSQINDRVALGTTIPIWSYNYPLGCIDTNRNNCHNKENLQKRIMRTKHAALKRFRRPVNSYNCQIMTSFTII